ncbi:MAG: OmpH family outer membrane protein [Deltaproteobacteria bacterium]|nr:OmpH family outer membrane protein [Deltaproteobacteria bacterium]
MIRFVKGIIAPLALLVFLAGPVCAADVKIGVVDVKEFQKKSTTFQKIRGELKGKFEALQQKLEEEKQALMKLEEDFRKQSMMLSLGARDDKRNELEKKRRYYKYLYEDLSEQMKDAERDATRRVLQELEDVVTDIAEKEGFTLILERNSPGMIHVDDSINITDRVTQAYDRANQ